MILRPYGVVIHGTLELGLELVLNGARVLEVRPHTAAPGGFVVSPAFVNAHSHLEYRGLQHLAGSAPYWEWIMGMSPAKAAQSLSQIQADCMLAAKENAASGVALIAEHSDRPFAGAALRACGIEGVIFQELITIDKMPDPSGHIASVEAAAQANRESFGGPVYLSPHAHFTVDDHTLAMLGASGMPISVHVAESEYESEFTREDAGPIAARYRALGRFPRTTGMNGVETLAGLGPARPKAQFVHCCAVESSEIELMASSGVSVAHCPRSNASLGCPIAPVREMLDAGIAIGLGLDSPASSGPIDMFAEMRAAVSSAHARGGALTPGETWLMATCMGAESLPVAAPQWDIFEGSQAPLIEIHVEGAKSVGDLIERGEPALVRRVSGGGPSRIEA